MDETKKYFNMFLHGMVLNGVLEVLEKARVSDYDPDQAIEELAFGLAVLCQMTQIPIEDGMRVLQRCADVQDKTPDFAYTQKAAEA
mgnify:FL=1|tara:strand:- start:31 stop:288 length:258 start_codon:yes stop_codon:yes gene_type:complete